MDKKENIVKVLYTLLVLMILGPITFMSIAFGTASINSGGQGLSILESLGNYGFILLTTLPFFGALALIWSTFESPYRKYYKISFYSPFVLIPIILFFYLFKNITSTTFSESMS